MVKNSRANAGDAGDSGDMGSVLGWGRFPGGGHSNLFQCSWLEEPGRL